ncbi:Auxin responsive SAUR protein [Quillaja saponaria]|uniref:Auxin responsive SAUR protein n=1 Tax=Quillaja saponaria TaxID=32244 RepID=A0AAD7LS54_QUISA|nr:Auxin responsive SAUR protein [Quillaja saponaria]
MAKLGKLTKLKSAIKRWPTFTKLSRSSSSISATSEESDHHVCKDLRAVCVGKSRRRYLVNSDIVEHPVFQELVEKSDSDDDGTVVACEVVLFEHLLWMIENDGTQLGSMDELVEFYA